MQYLYFLLLNSNFTIPVVDTYRYVPDLMRNILKYVRNLIYKKYSQKKKKNVIKF